MSWIEDRDLLLLETQMLINELAEAKPGVATPPPVAAIYQFEPVPDPSPSEALQFERIAPLPTVNQRHSTDVISWHIFTCRARDRSTRAFPDTAVVRAVCRSDREIPSTRCGG
jgi:hypothetical protein